MPTCEPDDEELLFDSIKEPRDSYFVEYQPPGRGLPFANLRLVTLQPRSPDEAAEALEEESRIWIARFPVPLMASAFDASEALISLEPVRDGSHLTAWRDPEKDTIVLSWRLGELDAFLKRHPTRVDLREVYSDVPFRTKVEVKAAALKRIEKQVQQARLLRQLLFLWAIAIPAGAILVELFLPLGLAVIVVAFSFWKLWRTWLRMTGRLTPSPREREEEERQRKMEHYHYHCERNPHGFQKLMVENLKEESRRRVQDEADELRGKLSD